MPRIVWRIFIDRMDSRARKALAVIQERVEADRFLLLPHFRQRLTQRGLVWPDVLAVLESPRSIRRGHGDPFRRSKWIVGGTASDGLTVEIACVLDVDEQGNLTVFITMF